MKDAKEDLISSWFKDAKIINFDSKNLSILFSRNLNTDMVSISDFRRCLNQHTNASWNVEIDYDSENGRSINDILHEDVEKRKNEAINSDIVQNIMRKFEGTEIISVNEIIPE